MISMLGFDGNRVRGRAAWPARLDFLHLGITVHIIGLDHGLGRLPIGVTLIAPLLGFIQLPVLVPALLTGVSIDLPI
jgi:hypothetical protein